MCPPNTSHEETYSEWLNKAKVVLILISPSYFTDEASLWEFKASCQQNGVLLLPVVVNPLPWVFPGVGPEDPEWCKAELEFPRRVFPNPALGTLLTDGQWTSEELKASFLDRIKEGVDSTDSGPSLVVAV